MWDPNDQIIKLYFLISHRMFTKILHLEYYTICPGHSERMVWLDLI